MKKYVSIFFLTIMTSVIFFIIFGSVFPAEDAVFTIGIIIVILISFLISQVYYLIDLIEKKL